MRIICFVMLVCLCAHGAFGTAVDKDALEYQLSMTFSDVYRTNGNEIALRVADHPIGFYVHRPADARGVFPHANSGDVFLLKIGDIMSFGVPDSFSSLKVTATNDVGDLVPRGGADDFSKPDGLFLVLHRSSLIRKRPTEDGVERHHRFIIDFGSGGYYDLERKSFGTVKLPFHSLWSDWDDYIENFSGLPKVDEEADLRKLGEIPQRTLIREDYLMSHGFLTFCRKTITNESPHVVLYMNRSMWNGVGESYLARVRVKAGKVEVLEAAVFRPWDTCPSGRLSVFDEAGRLRWYCMLCKSENEQSGRHYEFDGNGKVRRFVELDDRGREVERRRRNLRRKAKVMVAPADRAAFFADMRAAVRPLIEAWEARNYSVAPDYVYQPPKPTKEDEKIAAAVKERDRQDREKVAERNRRRRAAGLPDMTEKDEWLFLREERRETHRRWIERLRHEMTGRAETTELDALIDRERIRLHELWCSADRLYAVAIRTPGARPKTLRDLIGCKYLGTTRTLLVDGENDLRDLWGHEYRYYIGQGKKMKTRQDQVIIISAGPDGVFDTADDLSSEDWFVFRKFEFERDQAKGRQKPPAK